MEFHHEVCEVCKRSGKVVLCDSCVSVYHLHCLTPALKEVPPGTWFCPKCEVCWDIYVGYAILKSL